MDYHDLPEETQNRLRGLGYDVEKLTPKQVSALQDAEDPQRFFWLAKFFTYAGFIFGFMAILSLIGLNLVNVVFYALVGLLLYWIGYKMQMRVFTKKFLSAGLEKYRETSKARPSEVKRETPPSEESAMEEGDIWDKYYGEKNTKEVLYEKGFELGTMMPYIVTRMTTAFLENKDLKLGVKKKDFASFTQDVSILIDSYIDRVTFGELGEPQRGYFIDAYFAGMDDSFRSVGVNDESMTAMQDYTNTMLNYYGQFKRIYPEGDESFAGALIWEFGKFMAEKYTHEADLVLNMALTELTTNIFCVTDLTSLLTGEKAGKK